MISERDAITILERASEIANLAVSFDDGDGHAVIGITELASILAQMSDGEIDRELEEQMLQDSMAAQSAGVDSGLTLSQRMWKQYTAPKPNLDGRPWPLGTVETH